MTGKPQSLGDQDGQVCVLVQVRMRIPSSGATRQQSGTHAAAATAVPLAPRCSVHVCCQECYLQVPMYLVWLYLAVPAAGDDLLCDSGAAACQSTPQMAAIRQSNGWNTVPTRGACAGSRGDVLTVVSSCRGPKSARSHCRRDMLCLACNQWFASGSVPVYRHGQR